MANAVRDSSVIVAARDQISTDLGGEAVILALDSGQYYSLNDVGTRIWNLVQEPRNISDILDAILKEYNVEPGLCEKDLVAILNDMAAEGLIEFR